MKKERDTYLTQSTSTADESHSAGWKLQKYVHFHRDLFAPAMPTDMIQVCVALFPSF